MKIKFQSCLVLGLLLGTANSALAFKTPIAGMWISEEFFTTTGDVGSGDPGDVFENTAQQCQGYYIGSLFARPSNSSSNSTRFTAIDVAKVGDDGFKVQWFWEGVGQPIPQTISNQSISAVSVLAGISPPDNNNFPQGGNSATRGVTSSSAGTYGHSAIWYSPSTSPAVSTVVDQIVVTNGQITSRSNAHTVALVKSPGSKFEAWAYFYWWVKTQ
jgi:hypothetical protein